MKPERDEENLTVPERPSGVRRSSPPRVARGRPPIFAEGEIVADTYEIIGVLGEGGMGQVFEARDRVLDRRVAIKAAWPENRGESVQLEARALAALRHPSMVSVFHVGTHRGTQFVVMERIYGVSLRTHIDRRRDAEQRFTVREVLDVLIGIAEGIATVHRAGLAHRDVKPSNVMLAPGNRVVLMDFGLSLAEASVNMPASPVGTPGYMAPEAIMNDSRGGERFAVDLYALGVITYEMLTLQSPFRGATTAEVWTAHLSGPRPDPRELRDDVPPQLAELCTSLMAKTPDARPESIETVVARLRSLRGDDEARPRRNFSVLIVDDDSHITALLRMLVRSAAPAATVATAHDGEAAIRLVHRQPPDLLLLDLRMPTMNGIELAMYLRGTHLADSTTIVAVSALAKDDDVALLSQLGITRFIPKDPDMQTAIAGIIRELTERGS